MLSQILNTCPALQNMHAALERSKPPKTIRKSCLQVCAGVIKIAGFYAHKHSMN